MFNFWGKVFLRSKLSKWGFIRQLAAMVYCCLDAKTPKKVKWGMAAVIFYVIFPFDIVPDVMPVFGWLDDAGIAAGVLWLLSRYIQEEHWRKADALLYNKQKR
ncbi:MAG: DUF1232 domain-containing protein [Pelosinus sp.]|nr:DUF1232 domain-containing protein [Pelosinus sp.]